MTHELKKLNDSEVEFTITVPTNEYKTNLDAAANRLSERAAIKGFRPGKAPYEIVKQQLGEVRILEEAMQSIVEHNFFLAVQSEKLETIGMPQITLQKFAPGNDLVFTAQVALLPKVKLADIKKIKVSKKEVKVTDERLNETLDSLRKMRPQETLKEGASTKEDKLVVDLNMFIDHVAIEGGFAKNHQVYLSEPHYIPGLAEELVGLKTGDEKKFTLKFPTEHYQKMLAGKDVDFEVKVNQVFSLQYSELNEEFAKTLGQESVEKLKEILMSNLQKEDERKEDQRFEAEMLEAMIDQSEFETLPKVLIDAEKRKMFYELKSNLENQGISMEQYLQDLKKTEEEIFNDFATQAEKRAKAALISRQIALEQGIKVEKTDMDTEIELIKQNYQNDPKVLENLKRPEVIDTIASTIQNRKVVEWLKKQVLS